MLSLIAEDRENHCVSSNGSNHTTTSVQEIVKSLHDITKKAKQIGESEICFLASIALESAKEKLFLEFYAKH
jgi:hypothetical protein